MSTEFEVENKKGIVNITMPFLNSIQAPRAESRLGNSPALQTPV